MFTGRQLLASAGYLSLAIALLHLGIILAGAPAYRFFGGADLARLAAEGSLGLTFVTLCLAMIFSVFGLYALCGAGFFTRLPLLRTGLLAIGGIYTLRGLFLIPQLILIFRLPGSIPPEQIVFSFVSLLTGALYLTGIIASWQKLKPGGSV